VIRSRLTWHAERGRSDSPCERPCAGRGRPLAASLAPSAAEGTRPPHVCRYALHQLALQIACARGVCVLARARARQNLTKKSPLPASCIYPQQQLADLTSGQCHECPIGRVSVRVRACVRVVTPVCSNLLLNSASHIMMAPTPSQAPTPAAAPGSATAASGCLCRRAAVDAMALLARLDVRLADASPTDGAQDTAATPSKAAAYDR
jgi:hypothetical protein